MKRIRSLFPILCLLLCLCCASAQAEMQSPEEPSMAADDLMFCLGRPSKELAAAVGGYTITTWPEHKQAFQANVMQALISVEHGTDTGWEDGCVFKLMLMSGDYCLDGYRVGSSYKLAKERALSEGWILTLEDGIIHLDASFEKTIEGVQYTLNLYSDSNGDREQSKLQYVIMQAEPLSDTADH